MLKNEGSGNAIRNLAVLLLLMGFGAQALAYVFLLEEGLKIGSINFKGQEHIFGWYMQGFAIMLGVLTLIISLKLKE